MWGHQQNWFLARSIQELCTNKSNSNFPSSNYRYSTSRQQHPISDFNVNWLQIVSKAFLFYFIILIASFTRRCHFGKSKSTANFYATSKVPFIGELTMPHLFIKLGLLRILLHIWRVLLHLTSLGSYFSQLRAF